MRKNLISNALIVFAMIMSAAFAGNVSAQTGKNLVSSKITVAYAPEVAANVVINEVYGGSELPGNAYNADFIELYNNSAFPVNISDWSVQYYTAGQINGGAPTSTASIPDATILQAFSYYVIRVSPIRSSGASLPCATLNASATFAETGIASDAGKIVLSSTSADLPDCTSTLNVVDRVGYGLTPVVCNETTNAGQPSALTSVQRRVDIIDTDNNFADFNTFVAPTPCVQLSAPTAAMVNVGGRVTNADGRGISKALIRMTDGAGFVRMAYTTSSGYYNFPDVEAGQTLIFDVRAKRYNFTAPTQVVSLTEESTAVDFTAYYISGKFIR